MTPFELRAPLETERLVLRGLTEADVDAVHAHQSLPEVARYTLYEPRTRAEVADWVARHRTPRRLERDGDYLQLAVERRSDGRVIGDLYFSLRSAANATAELGWTLHPEAQGAGYATEGARALLGLAFETLALHRVVAELDPRNVASARLCERLGMRHEAHLVENEWFKGEWTDEDDFALLRQEWSAHDA